MSKPKEQSPNKKEKLTPGIVYIVVAICCVLFVSILLIGDTVTFIKYETNKSDVFSAKYGDYDELTKVKEDTWVIPKDVTSQLPKNSRITVLPIQGETYTLSTYPYNLDLPLKELLQTEKTVKITHYMTQDGKAVLMLKLQHVPDYVEKHIRNVTHEDTLYGFQYFLSTQVSIGGNDLLKRYEHQMKHRTPQTVYIMAFPE